MLLTVLQENLQTSLGYLQRAIPSKPQLPILSAIMMQVTKTECVLAATDLYMGIRTTIPVVSDEEKTIIIPGKQFKEIISSITPGKITLEYADKTLIISSGKTKATLQCFSDEEYPPFPVVEGETFSITKEQLHIIETHVAFSASSDQTRPILTSIFFDFSPERLVVAGTDGFRLAVMELVHTTTQAQTLLIPARAIVEISRIAEQLKISSIAFTVSQELKQVLFSLDSVEVFVRLITGEYPPYQKILPASFTTEATIDKKDLIEAIKQALIFARDSSNITQMEFSEGKVKISATSPSLGTFERELTTTTFSGEVGEIAFNSKYLLDFLLVVEEDIVWFGMSDSLKPVLFKIPGYDQFKYVVMPFKINK